MRFLFLFVIGLFAGSLGFSSTVTPQSLGTLKDDPEKVQTVVVALREPYDLNKLPKEFHSQEERGKKIARILQAHTNKILKKNFPFLVVDPQKGIEEVTPLWINHSVRVKATEGVIEKLKSRGAESIFVETRKEVSEMEDLGLATIAPQRRGIPTVAWGVEKLRAPELWSGEFDGRKIDGKGVLVAVIDSGVAIDHPDLAPNIYQNPGETGTDREGRDRATNGIDDDENGFIDDANGWNFEDGNGDVADLNGHGSQTAGIVGGVGTGGTQTGVAPGATLLPIRACCDLGGQVGESAIMQGMEYAILMGAKVISMSLSIKHYSKPSYALWRKASETVLAAGVIHINSAGNRGSGNEPNNIGAPASNPPAWFHLSQTQGNRPTSMITIGATDQNDKLRNYSSVGPVSWENILEYKDFPYLAGDRPGLIKPEVCGPSEVPSTSMDGKSYTKSFGGTSSATPHIGGVAALLVSVYPDLSPAQATEALQMSAIEVEGGGYTNKCGSGRVDAVAAVRYVEKHFLR